MSVPVAAVRRRRSLDELRDELRFRAVRDDFVKFCTECVRIERKDLPQGYGPFVMLPHQLDLADTLCTRRKVISLKARQLGVTTEVAAFFLWRAIRTPGFKGLILSHGDLYAKETLERLRQMLLQLPDWLLARLPKSNEASGNLILDYGGGVKSVIVSLTITKTVGASFTADCVFFDEAGLAEYASDAFATLSPTLDATLANAVWPGAVIIVASTARGGSNWFATMWRRGVGYAKVFYPWNVSPYYTQHQYDQELADAKARGEEHKHFQERPVNPEEAFRKSGRGRFPMAPRPETCHPYGLVGVLVKDASGEPEFRPMPEGELHVAELPVKGRRYYMSVDPAHGKGLDYTVMTVTAYDEAGLPYIAAYWRCNDMEPFDQAHRAYDLGTFYRLGVKPALIAVEKAGGHGDTIITVLRGLNYRNLYRYTPTTNLRRVARTEYGLVMSKSTKAPIMDNFAQMLPDLANISYDLALELSAFVVKDNGKQEADSGAHDDMVDSAAIACWVMAHATNQSAQAMVTPGTAMGDETTPEPAVLTLDLAHIFKDADKAHAAKARFGQKLMTQRRRATRVRHTRTR